MRVVSPALPSSLSFPRSLRLVTGRQFQTVFQHPDWRVSNRQFLILARANQRDHPRLGLVIGRRRARRAVDRGAIKRRAREQFRQRQQRLAGVDVILLLRAPYRRDGTPTLTAELALMLDKLLAKREQD